MKTSESLLSIGKFIAEYSAHLMGAGVHTSRVVRNSNINKGQPAHLHVRADLCKQLLPRSEDIYLLISERWLWLREPVPRRP